MSKHWWGIILLWVAGVLVFGTLGLLIVIRGVG